MSGRLIVAAYMPALDGNGDPISGAMLYVYQNLTTSLAPIYADAGLSTQLSNPLQANAAGQFPAIYIADGSVRSVAVTDANGFPVAAFDNVAISTVVQVSPASVTGAVQAALANLQIQGLN